MSTSPWIDELDKDRPTEKLTEDIDADIVIVGAGIAGISTAFFTLQNTNRSVVVLEGRLLAHGASGHNAGMLTGDTEKPIYEIEAEYGSELTRELVSGLASGWKLLEQIAAATKVPYSTFVGYGGMLSLEDLLEELKNHEARRGLGFEHDPVLAGDVVVSEHAPYLHDIPEALKGSIRIGSPEEIQKLLNTKSKDFTAAVPERLGVMNSALLCQEAVKYLKATYSDRFALYEHAPVRRVALHADGAVLDAGDHTINAKTVVLCTNGFEDFTIFNNNLQVDTSFHETVTGLVGYMLGLKTAYSEQSGGAWFMTDRNLDRKAGGVGKETQEDPYVYVTHRPRKKGNELFSLVCIGGHEELLPDHTAYRHDHPYPKDVRDAMCEIFFDLWGDSAPHEPLYEWHGLMGYTRSGVRLAGVEPQNPHLFYNLGCNGIGILPSLVGADRIAKILNGEALPQSIMDPEVQERAHQRIVGATQHSPDPALS